MRKIFTLLLSLTATLTVAAQGTITTPDWSFDNAWVNCVPWNGTHEGHNATQYGTQPVGWCIANVSGMSGGPFLPAGTGNTLVGSQIAHDTLSTSNKAVLLVNTPNTILKTQIVPGYMTLGTAWNTSVMGQNNDGGTFGGIKFSGRPDALTFLYKRAHGEGSTEPFQVVAYTWKGTTIQKEVPTNIVMSGNPNKEDMTDRDRNILGIDTYYGGEVKKTGDFQLVGSINEKVAAADTAQWTPLTLNFNYSEKKLTPEKLNIIFSSGNFFENVNKANDSLAIDSVALVYYSRLSDIRISGKTIDGFRSDKYDYTVVYDGDATDVAFDLAYDWMGYAAENKMNATMQACTIKVTNPDGADIDGLSEHTYTIKVIGKQEISGKLDVAMGGMAIISGQDTKINIAPAKEAGHVDFTLPDLKIVMGDTLKLGDIAVPNMKMYRDDEQKRTYYEGEVEGMHLMDSLFVANVKCYGYVADDGTIDFKIPVAWITEAGNVTIDVRFYNGTIDMTEDPKVPEALGITSVGAPAAAPASVYNISGQRVGMGSHGLRIIRRADGRVVKVMR